ncbi:MAG: hypothetical protein KBD17_01505 [Candidatus Pacebacteria bacterium]|nr:hypothetical protein [Candidatus Paceibacterota bacterium]
MINFSNKKNSGGFTIIETMISVALFIVITTVGMGALLNGNLLYQKSQDMRTIIDNLNFTMEDMSRNIRTGYNYRCYTSSDPIIPTDDNPTILSVPRSCASGGGWAIAFESAYGDNTVTDGNPVNYKDQWIYRIDAEGKIFKATTGPYTTSSFVQLTPDEVDIDPALSSFVVTGAEPTLGDTAQPSVTMRLVGTITYQNVVSPFAIQTTVSQRLLDI